MDERGRLYYKQYLEAEGKIIMKKQEIMQLVEAVHSMKKDKSTTLANNSFFLANDTIVCFPNPYGDSRYPYECDGLALYTHSNGYIDCVESMLNVFRPTAGGLEENAVVFFAGEKSEQGYIPISITGASSQLYEDIMARYTVFKPECAYYITETEKAIFSLRVYVDTDKHILFSVGAINKAEEREIYLCSYMEPTLSPMLAENVFSRIFKFAEHFDNGNYVLTTIQGTTVSKSNAPAEDITNNLNVNVAVHGNVTKRYFTTAKNTFMGRRGANTTNATALKTGEFLKQVTRTNTTEWTVASDMIHFLFEEDGYISMDYMLTLSDNKDTAYANSKQPVDSEKIDAVLREMGEMQKAIYSNTKLQFEGEWHNEKLDSSLVNSFLRCVQKQVSHCALGKNYAGGYLGMRDVFQQLESVLIWQPKEARKQIVRVMNYILEDGRTPRQISFAEKEDIVPDFDLRPFIDQGFWIVAAIHNYLAYTSDYSILEEVCGYFKAEHTFGPLDFSTKRDTILEHLIQITDYLISNVDEQTHCVHALWGDWNDQVNGLGRTNDPNKEFGDGVSMMATFQLYLALDQMMDIIEHTNKDANLLERYIAVKRKLVEGVLQNAIVQDDKGFHRIVHGWGEGQGYYVGSFSDFDGKSRISLTSNAFAAISGMLKEFPQIKEDVAQNILDSDSKYGLLTFTEHFTKPAPEVGSIQNITPGTYENKCAYAHAGTFGIMALFLMGYSEEAWRILEKTMVISREKVTLTTFVMPNSYCYNEFYGFDGESMGDWHTGSGTVLLKGIIKYAFGVEPSMDTLKISPASYFPTDNAQMSFHIGQANVTVKYRKQGLEKRKICLNGEEMPLEFDEIRGVHYTLIAKTLLKSDNIVEITD